MAKYRGVLPMTDITPSNMSTESILKAWPREKNGLFQEFLFGTSYSEWRLAKNNMWYWYVSRRTSWKGFQDGKPKAQLRASTGLLRPNGNIWISLISQRPFVSTKQQKVVFPCKRTVFVMKPVLNPRYADWRSIKRGYNLFLAQKNNLKMISLDFKPWLWPNSLETLNCERLYFSRKVRTTEIVIRASMPPSWFVDPTYKTATYARDHEQLQLQLELDDITKRFNGV